MCLSEVEHRHGLELAAVGNSGLDPGATLEEPQEGRHLGAVVDVVGVLTCLDDKPGRNLVVLMLVRSDSQLKRVDPNAEGVRLL